MAPVPKTEFPRLLPTLAGERDALAATEGEAA